MHYYNTKCHIYIAYMKQKPTLTWINTVMNFNTNFDIHEYNFLTNCVISQISFNELLKSAVTLTYHISLHNQYFPTYAIKQKTIKPTFKSWTHDLLHEGHLKTITAHKVSFPLQPHWNCCNPANFKSSSQSLTHIMRPCIWYPLNCFN